MTAIIDADAILYIVAWHNREEPDAVNWLYSADNVVNTMLLMTGSTGYYGVFSSSGCFRYDRYKVKPYKGTRKEKEPWFRERETVIRDHLTRQWGFFRADNLEADDVVCYLGESLRLRPKPVPHVICSPDKDLKQIPGMHYDYSKDVKSIITPEEADYLFWCQMLTGDETDNIAGIPGTGIKKAEELLKKALPVTYRMLVEEAYNKYFGSYYGCIIFAETFDCIKLIGTEHAYFSAHSSTLHQYLLMNYNTYTPRIKAPTSAESAIASMFAG